MIRNGNHRGSGTVIASIPGTTLILTAAHVVSDKGDLAIEIQRYNLGFNDPLNRTPGWPRIIPAQIEAIDVPADVAVIRVSGLAALPHVARLAPEAEPPKPGVVLTSVGIDGAVHLTSWRSDVLGAARVEVHKGGGARPFTVTTKPPEHGRSGGGLFRPDGAVIGVCVGRLTIGEFGTVGLFASPESVYKLLREKHLDTFIARMEPRSGGPVETTAAPSP